MKIAVLNVTGGGISGGHRKYLANILAPLASLNRGGTILCASPSNINVGEWLPPVTGINFTLCEPFKPFRHSPDPALRLALDAFSPDLLFIPIERYVGYKGVPVVVMLQNMAPLAGAKTGRGVKEWLVSIMRRYETRYALKRAVAVIVPSDYVRDFLTRHEGVPARKIFVVPYGNSRPTSAPAKPAGINLTGRKFIFTAGSMELYRGFEDLVHALPAVKEAVPGISLVIAGGTRPGTEGYLEGLKKYAVSAGVAEDIVFLGNIAQAELSWCYSNCSLFVLSSRVESFCFVALEALAHGCRIISSDSPCLPEVLRDAASYYKAGDSGSLANLIVGGLASAPAGQSRVALDRASEFSWDTASRQTFDVFLRVLRADI